MLLTTATIILGFFTYKASTENNSLKSSLEIYKLNEIKYKTVIANDSIKIDSLFSIINDLESTLNKKSINVNELTKPQEEHR